MRLLRPLLPAVFGFLLTASAASSQIHNSREWKRLRAQARTPEDFAKLAEWCNHQVAENLGKAERCDRERQEFLQQPVGTGPKYPPRDQTLRTLASHYRELAAHWKALGEECSARATSRP